MEKKILIVCFSHFAGNTRNIARRIRGALDGDLVELKMQTPYDDNYNEVLKRSRKEIKEGYLPPLKGVLPSIADYDVIAVGSPVWWLTMAPPLRTFLLGQDRAVWTGKIVIPFVTHGGFPGKALRHIEECCPGAQFMEEMAVRFDSRLGNQMKTPAAQMEAWLKRCRDRI